MNDNSYNFTNKWFETESKAVWDVLIEKIKPKKVLEIGSYEGASCCYFIDKLAVKNDLEIHCIDNWKGGEEHQKSSYNMSSVEKRFKENTALALNKATQKVEFFVHKEFSEVALSKLFINGKQNFFDFIYIDGSHKAPDVLSDAILSFKLLKKEGIMVFDDYLWQEKHSGDIDIVRCPKLAIDAFTNVYCKKIRIIRAPLSQLYIKKIKN